MHELPCPVCGTDQKATVDRRKLSRGIHRNVWCASCGMVWSSPRPSASVYLDFYRSDYTEAVYGLDGSEKSADSVVEWRRRRSREKIGYFPKFWKRGQRVLEIGAGIGAFLDVLRTRYGCRTWGIEPASAFVAFARKAFGLKLFEGSFEEWRKRKLKYFPAKFDRIVMDQILEHILDPLSFLQSLHPLLTKDGQLFISVPNIVAPKEAKSKFFIFEHVSSFSPLPLCLLLLRAGFKPTGLFAEKPGSLQVTAAPLASSVTMLSPDAWGKPLALEALRRGFSKL